MSIPKWKRRESELDYVDNSYTLQGDIMNLASKLSARWARIYQQPIDRLACLQFDLVNMASSINPTSIEEYITRRWLLKMSRGSLQALENKLMDMVRILYMNPSKCFSRKNGKNYSRGEATEMLDKKLETLGVNFQRQYDLIKGVLDSDKKKMNKVNIEDVSDKEVMEMLISKSIRIFLE